jgi:hypothetical protein
VSYSCSVYSIVLTKYSVKGGKGGREEKREEGGRKGQRKGGKEE